MGRATDPPPQTKRNAGATAELCLVRKGKLRASGGGPSADDSTQTAVDGKLRASGGGPYGDEDED